jgi:hypothetical protein
MGKDRKKAGVEYTSYFPTLRPLYKRRLWTWSLMLLMNFGIQGILQTPVRESDDPRTYVLFDWQLIPQAHVLNSGKVRV